MGWRVSSYVLSKGVAAGAMMLALALIAGADGAALADVAPGLLAMAGIAYALSVAARLDAEDARDVLAWAMVSDGIRPGIVAASHHMGRWRLKDDEGVQRWASALVDVQEEGAVMRFRQIPGVQPWESSDPSSQRVWWNDAGVRQNITFPVHRDPISGVHCWQQMVRLSSAHTEDRYIDTDKARAVYRKCHGLARPAAGPLRRTIWLFRPVKTVLDATQLPQSEQTEAARANLRDTELPGIDELAQFVDWDPAAVWGQLPQAHQTAATS